jgi:hypothetical protein
MKRKELYNFIREEIVNELKANENVAVELTGTTGKTVQSFKDLTAANKFKSENPNVKAVKALEEDGLEEMARIPNNVKVGDIEKFKAAKDLYSGSWREKMLDVIEAAGEEGISQAELAIASGKKSQPEINPSVREFLGMGALALARTSSLAKPEKPEIEEPEIEEPSTVEPTSVEPEDSDEEEVKDDWEKPEEEEAPEVEPKSADIKAAEKAVGGKGYAKKLSPEDEERYAKLKKGIESKVAKLDKLSPSKRVESDDLKVLKQLINREDVKKLFKDKGIDLKDLVADVM